MHGGTRAALGAALLVLAALPAAGGEAAGRLLGALETHRVVVLGERHGFEPGHRLFARVATEAAGRLPGVVVGLELPADLQDSLDRGALPRLPPVVGTPSYARLLRSLAPLARRGELRLLALDLPSGERGDRDAHMARRIEGALAGGARRVLVLVGNLHAWGAGGRLGGRLRAAGIPCILVGALPGAGAARWLAPGRPGFRALVVRLGALLPPAPRPVRALDAVISWANGETKTARR